MNAFLSLCARGSEWRVFRRTSNKAFGLKRSLREAQVRRQVLIKERKERSQVLISCRFKLPCLLVFSPSTSKGSFRKAFYVSKKSLRKARGAG